MSYQRIFRPKTIIPQHPLKLCLPALGLVKNSQGIRAFPSIQSKSAIPLYLGRIVALTDDDIQPLWDALQAYQEVDSEFDRQRGIANVHQALGDHAQQRADYLSAEEHYRTALSICGLINYHRGQAHALGALGSLAQLRGDLAGAEQYYQEGLAAYRQANDPSGEANALRALGDLATSKRDLLTAARYFREAFAL